MTMWRKIGRRLAIGFVLLVLVAIGAVHAMGHFMSYTDVQIRESFADKDTSVRVFMHDADGIQVRVVEELGGTTDSLLIVFVHGAPGDHSAFKFYMEDPKMQSLGKLVSYDRPGYGKSSRQAMTSIDQQADVLHSIVEHYNLPKVLVIGHSYGGPIVANALDRYSDSIVGAIMIAPLIDPYNEPIFWFSYLAKWKLTKWLLPNSMKVAGREKFSHAAELEKMEDIWQSMTSPILHIHGANDVLAPAEHNIAWSRKYVDNTSLSLEVVEDEGHLIIWQGYAKVRDLIKEFVANL